MTIQIFYSPQQTASRNLSRSPSAQKPALVVEAWKRTGLPLQIQEPRSVTMTDLCRAHDPAYVRGVLAGRIPNGFGNTGPGDHRHTAVDQRLHDLGCRVGGYPR